MAANAPQSTGLAIGRAGPANVPHNSGRRSTATRFEKMTFSAYWKTLGSFDVADALEPPAGRIGDGNLGLAAQYERIDAQLQPHSFPNFEVSRECHVTAAASRAVRDVATRSTQQEGPVGTLRESARTPGRALNQAPRARAREDRATQGAPPERLRNTR